MCYALVDQVQSTIMALAVEDESGTQCLLPGVARKSAADAVLGRLRAWRLLHFALMVVSELLFEMRHHDAGVGKLEWLVNASASSGRLAMDVSSLQQRLRRLSDLWELKCRYFRVGGRKGRHS